MNATLHMYDNSSSINKEIIKFLRSSIDTINRSGIKIVFNIVTKKKKPKRISSIPALEYEGKLYEDDIVEKLESLTKKHIQRRNVRNDLINIDDDMLNDYISRELSFEAFEKDKGETESNDPMPGIMSRYSADIAQRRATHKPDPFNGNNFKRKDNIDYDMDPVEMRYNRTDSDNRQQNYQRMNNMKQGQQNRIKPRSQDPDDDLINNMFEET